MENDKELIYKLSEEYDNGADAKIIEPELKKLLEPYKDGSIGLAQINPIAGDIEYNAAKVVKYIKHAENIGLDLVVFPELILMGYPIEDTIDRHPVIVEENVKWLKEIAKITTKTTAIVGFVEPRKYDNLTGKKYYNSAAVLQDGKITGIIRKSLLPTYSEFNDYRYIEPSPVVGSQCAETLGCFSEEKIENCAKTNLISGKKYAISICEDCWNNKEFFNDTTLYSLDPIEELSKEKPDVFINCSASPTRAKKEQLKHNMLSFIAKKYSTPIIYVNQVGAIDNSSLTVQAEFLTKTENFLPAQNLLKNNSSLLILIKILAKSIRLQKDLNKLLQKQKFIHLNMSRI